MAKGQEKQIIEVGQYLRDLVLQYTAVSNEIILTGDNSEVYPLYLKRKEIEDNIAGYVVHKLCEYDVKSHLFLNKNLSGD